MANTITITPAGGSPTTWKVASPWGHQENREYKADNVHQWGRCNASDPSPATRTDTVRIWVHRRSDSNTWAQDVQALYDAVQTWVGAVLTIVDNTSGETYSGAIAESWECAPEEIDSQTVALNVELVVWDE